jgi:hypothetical protein
MIRVQTPKVRNVAEAHIHSSMRQLRRRKVFASFRSPDQVRLA